MPKISTLGQKLWPTGREQTDRRTHRRTDRQRKQTLRTPFFEIFFLIFDFLLKERSDKFEKGVLSVCFLCLSVCACVCLSVRGL